jgi:hypothetical protein
VLRRIGLLALALGVVCPAAATAQPLAEGHQRAVQELVDITIFKSGVFDALVHQASITAVQTMKPALQQQTGRAVTPDEEAKLVDAMRASILTVLPRAAWEPFYLAVFSKHFSEAETAELLQFYRTPVGAKVSGLSGTLMSEGGAAGIRLVEQNKDALARTFAVEAKKRFDK